MISEKKILLWRSYLYNGNPYPGEIYIEMDAGTQQLNWNKHAFPHLVTQLRLFNSLLAQP